MTEEHQNEIIADETLVEPVEDTSLAPVNVDLNEESKAILAQYIKASDETELAKYDYLFNVNHKKKTMMRIDQLNRLQDTLVSEATDRLTSRPGEISNKELFDGMKTIQDLMERGQKQVADIETEKPVNLIQINNINNAEEGSARALSRDSREKVKNAVMGILGSLNMQMPVVTDTEVVETEIVEAEEDGEE